ncbi:MAG: hydroxylase [Rhodothermales bacterium]|nr:hydroxylase [Rhodothermales bacterium]
MPIHYLEIVTEDVDAVCSTYESSTGIRFGDPVAELGEARTAELPEGTIVGVRAPMHESEDPTIRPYWLVNDIEATVSAAEAGGAVVAHPPMEIPGRGTFAILAHGSLHHGLWQL